ncbi:uncharacterized protein LOC62_03G003659 [Vanrija pseudolonga]|uniref:Uncharacterized protein n=1 Tax=Vanrija pseudolonga TaxID=143232 RepID=A0AAF0Y9D6_9TREE|nr:hypothetical protein LOC62_03G003659 [Vanrija pseudolonga]
MADNAGAAPGAGETRDPNPHGYPPILDKILYHGHPQMFGHFSGANHAFFPVTQHNPYHYLVFMHNKDDDSPGYTVLKVKGMRRKPMRLPMPDSRIIIPKYEKEGIEDYRTKKVPKPNYAIHFLITAFKSTRIVDFRSDNRAVEHLSAAMGPLDLVRIHHRTDGEPGDPSVAIKTGFEADTIVVFGTLTPPVPVRNDGSKWSTPGHRKIVLCPLFDTFYKGHGHIDRIEYHAAPNSQLVIVLYHCMRFTADEVHKVKHRFVCLLKSINTTLAAATSAQYPPSSIKIVDLRELLVGIHMCYLGTSRTTTESLGMEGLLNANNWVKGILPTTPAEGEGDGDGDSDEENDDHDHLPTYSHRHDRPPIYTEEPEEDPHPEQCCCDSLPGLRSAIRKLSTLVKDNPIEIVECDKYFVSNLPIKEDQLLRLQFKANNALIPDSLPRCRRHDQHEAHECSFSDSDSSSDSNSDSESDGPDTKTDTDKSPRRRTRRSKAAITYAMGMVLGICCVVCKRKGQWSDDKALGHQGKTTILTPTGEEEAEKKKQEKKASGAKEDPSSIPLNLAYVSKRFLSRIIKYDGTVASVSPFLDAFNILLHIELCGPPQTMAHFYAAAPPDYPAELIFKQRARAIDNEYRQVVDSELEAIFEYVTSPASGGEDEDEGEGERRDFDPGPVYSVLSRITHFAEGLFRHHLGNLTAEAESRIDAAREARDGALDGLAAEAEGAALTLKRKLDNANKRKRTTRAAAAGDDDEDDEDEDEGTAGLSSGVADSCVAVYILKMYDVILLWGWAD